MTKYNFPRDGGESLGSKKSPTSAPTNAPTTPPSSGNNGDFDWAEIDSKINAKLIPLRTEIKTLKAKVELLESTCINEEDFSKLMADVISATDERYADKKMTASNIHFTKVLALNIEYTQCIQSDVIKAVCDQKIHDHCLKVIGDIVECDASWPTL